MRSTSFRFRMDWSEVEKYLQRLNPWLGRVDKMVPNRYRQRLLNLVKKYDELEAQTVLLCLLLTSIMIISSGLLIGEVLGGRTNINLYSMFALGGLMLLLGKRLKVVGVSVVLLSAAYIVYRQTMVVVSCPKLTAPENGKIELTHYSQSTAPWIAKYKCDHGYLLSGSSTLMCLDEHWSDQPPKCILQDMIVVSCPELTAPTNGEIEIIRPSQRRGPWIAKYKCNYGYFLYGSPTLVCLDEHWSDQPPKCVFLQDMSVANCPELTAPKNGKIEFMRHSQYTGPWIAKYKCNYGYFLSGSPTLVCLDEHWSDQPPKCILQVANIRGIKVLYHETYSIPYPLTVMKTLNLENYGIKIHVPSNPSSTHDEFSITVVVALSGIFHAPNETELVSAIYYIEASSQVLKPLVLEIEHCIIFQEIAPTFGKVELNNDTKLPYVFNQTSNGYFARDTSSGTIETSVSHSLWGVFMVAEKYAVKYSAWPLISHVHQGKYKVHLVTFQNLNAKKMEIDKEYLMSEWRPLMKQFNFRFTNESKKLKLRISEEGVRKGQWLIEPIHTPEISKEDIDDDVGICEIEITWTGEPSEEKQLKYFVSVDGINVRSFKIVINP